MESTNDALWDTFKHTLFLCILPDNGAVINLESSSFYEQVQDSDRSWLVLFYSSWCGHCINYVPIYTEVANRLQGIVPYFQKQWYGRSLA